MGLLGDDYKVLVTQMKVYRDESIGEIGSSLGKKKGKLIQFLYYYYYFGGLGGLLRAPPTATSSSLSVIQYSGPVCLTDVQNSGCPD